MLVRIVVLSTVGIIFGVILSLGDNAQLARDVNPIARKATWLSELSLNAKQESKLRNIWTTKRSRLDELQAEVQARRQELKDYLAGDSSDEDRARELHRQIQTLMIELGNIDLESMLEIRDLLSPQQRIRFVELMSQRGKFGEN